MEFAKTRHVLGHVRSLHLDAATAYNLAGHRVTTPRINILLGYLERHAAQFAKGLERYVRDASPAVLETFFQYVPEIRVPRRLAALGLDREPTIDEVFDVALDFDQRMSAFYGQMADASRHRAVREAFLSLRQLQETEHDELMVQSVRVFDI